MGIGFAAKIVTIIVKSVVNRKVGSELGKELIGASIDGVSERSITEINNFISGKKSKLEYILSEEKMKKIYVADENIDFVIAELKHLLSKVEITDELFRRCRYKHENLKDILWSEYRSNKNIIENESDIEKGLDAVAETLIELVCESEEFEKNLLIHISNTIDDANIEIQKISGYMHKNCGNIDKEIQMILVTVQMILEQIQKNGIEKQKAQKKIKSRTKEYSDKWDANMFLNDFNEWDENAGVNVKLKDVYIKDHLPHFIWGSNRKESSNLNVLLPQYIENTGENRMLLILGQPGIGKSTLITWITANFFSKMDDILVYKFASDLGKINWKDSRVSNRILEELGLEYSDLNGKTLILDGFDEVSAEENSRRDVLDCLYGDWIYDKVIKDFSLIITCRENYIKGFERVKCNYIILQPWNEFQINSFCNIFHEKTENKISESTIEKTIENRDVFGIPIILYMVLALNISIEKEGSIVDVYDKIFSLEGGIYDRCIDHKKFADSHRIGGVKKQIHQISRNIAVWMFENNPNKASIPQEEYQKICINVIQESEQENHDIIQDFKIGGFFKQVRHCEGLEAEELYFIHRTVYEYFVVENIFCPIENVIMGLTKEGQKELAGNIAFYLKKGKITYTIGSYLYHRIIRSYNKMSNEKKLMFYPWWESTIVMMIEYGMFFFTNKSIKDYQNIMFGEANCFLNMIDILRLILHIGNNKYILENADNSRVGRYVKYCIMNCEKCNFSYLNMELIDLRFLDLSDTNLSGANLSNANLSGANLSNANLSGANLEGANLEYANLESTNLEYADLHNAQMKELERLRYTKLLGANLDGVNLVGANFMGKNLQKVSICFADLTGINLSDANLMEADLSESKLCNAVLKSANLIKVDLIGSDLRGANLQKANLYKSSLNGAILINVDLRETNLYEANINGSTWTEQDIKKILPKLVNTVFKSIVVETKDNGKKVIYRQELFTKYVYMSDI